MSTTEIPRRMSVKWLQEQYAKQAVTPAEVIAAIIQRAEEDAGMNIWITPPEIGRLQHYIDRLISVDPAEHPLWGIPFAIKDNIDLAGTRTTAGCPDYAYEPDNHAAVVERLIAAGAIPLGKTNLDQFATGLVGTRSPYGETHNSIKPELISGGSSSGSSVAVARGHAAFALGTDTAGSGRVPAALNRLVGYKPSLGAWPTKGVVPACASLDCVTVFAHSLGDALEADRIARGKEAADPWSKELAVPIPKLPGKILLPIEQLLFYGPYGDEYRSAWIHAVGRLERTGIRIEYADTGLFSQAAAILYEGPWVAERWADLGSFVESHPGSTFPVTEQILRSGAKREYDAASVFKAMHALQVYKLDAGELLKDAVLAMPTCGGTWTREQVRKDPVSTNREMGNYTNHCNLLDLCAVAVPSDDAAHDLPFGISLFALAGNEGLICGAAQLFANQTTSLAAENDEEPDLNGVETTLVAVCGLHMRGYPLEAQMRACGARFVREDATKPAYQLVKLPTIPAKPGLIRQKNGGASIQLEVWEMPLSAFGGFASSIPAPLGIGKVELRDGTEVPGFLCESYAAADSEDITSSGGWRNAGN